jgi:hypothetical protein
MNTYQNEITYPTSVFSLLLPCLINILTPTEFLQDGKWDRVWCFSSSSAVSLQSTEKD